MAGSMINAAKHLHDNLRKSREEERKLKRLESAAPDLLEALKLAEQAMQNNYKGDMAEAFKVIREAIKRAES